MTPVTSPTHSPSTPGTSPRIPQRKNCCASTYNNLRDTMRRQHQRLKESQKEGFEETHKLIKQQNTANNEAQAETNQKLEQIEKKVDDLLNRITSIEQQQTAINMTLAENQNGFANLNSAIASVTELSKTMSTTNFQMNHHLNAMTQQRDQFGKQMEVFFNRSTSQTPAAIPPLLQIMPFCKFCRVNGHRSEDCRTYGSFSRRVKRAQELGICEKCAETSDGPGTTAHTKCPASRVQCDNCKEDREEGPLRNHDKIFCPMIEEKVPKRSREMGGLPGAKRGRGGSRAVN
uniref:CCHC-type domain-containing protein n=1 Tax=Caenorhabditis tropicalis TaxID=1561998 RepID=A0A1I7TTY9_9PELO